MCGYYSRKTNCGKDRPNLINYESGYLKQTHTRKRLKLYIKNIIIIAPLLVY